MKKTKRVLTLMLAAMMSLSLCACGSNGRAYKSAAPTPAPAEGNYNSTYSSFVTEEAAEMAIADYDTGDYGFSTVATPAAATNSEARGTEQETLQETPDKIIYSADVTVETTEFDDTVGKVSGLVEKYGGWVESSSVSGSNYYQKARGTASARDASYTLRIPSGHFQELMDSLPALGNVPYSHIYTENVTAQYYDAQAHLKAYSTQEERLLEMMKIAETVEDIIIIEDRLTELRYKIESLQSSLNNWDRRVSYSTIYLSLKEVREYTPEEKVNPSYGEELLEALKDGLYNAGQFLKNLLVFIVEVLPVLIILIPVIWLLVWLIGKLIKRLTAKRAARREAKGGGKKAAKAAADPESPEKKKPEEI